MSRRAAPCIWKGLASKDYLRLSEITASKLWRGQSAQSFREMIRQRKLVPGIQIVFDFLHRHGIATAIVSSGPYQLAERAQALFSITDIRANRLDIDGRGIFVGTVEVQVLDNAKQIAGKALQERFGATFETTAMIGDSASDQALASIASLSIAYDADCADFLQACNHRLNSGEMERAVALLAARVQ
ncbi:hypothetical protein HDN1F_07860 [gamma proteobacterium HdN1]|nr:hypothetical protein HDN1F_07860 [gamma proteobacterium HdN1]